MDEDELGKYNVVLNGQFTYYPRNSTLLVFDCNMTRYLYSLKDKKGEMSLKYLQQTPWTHQDGSLYINECRSRFVVIPEVPSPMDPPTIVQWQTTTKASVYLWMFAELAKLPSHQNLFRPYDFYKAVALLN